MEYRKRVGVRKVIVEVFGYLYKNSMNEYVLNLKFIDFY